MGAGGDPANLLRQAQQLLPIGQREHSTVLPTVAGATAVALP